MAQFSSQPLAPFRRFAAELFPFQSRRITCSVAAILILGVAGADHAAAQVSVTTYHNDNARTGQNLSETLLTPANVNSTQFGKLYAGSVTLDSWAPAQPLYVANVMIAGASHNVVYVSTLNNSVYAFDADSGQQLWYANYGAPTPFDNLCGDSGYVASPSAGAGIVGTPVIDPVAGIIYFVTKTGTGSPSTYALNLHAVDITTGIDEAGSPVVITPPSGPTFMPQYQMNRPALLLNNGYVYVGLGSTGCKNNGHLPTINNHGWVLGYNTLSLSQPPSLFVTSPSTNNAGIWQSGGGLSADSSGDIYFTTADGVFDANNGGSDYGLSVVKLDPNLNLLDFFTPYNEATLLEPNDLDLSSVSPLVLEQPGQDTLVVASGKGEEVYVLDPDGMGEFCGSDFCNVNTGNTNIVQDILPPAYLSGCLGEPPTATCRYGSPSFWSNGTSSYVYFPEMPGPLLSYSVSSAGFNTTPTSTTNFPGVGSPSISSNGSSNGILWTITWVTGASGKNTATLRAFDATNLQTQFYASNLASGNRDAVGYVPNFVSPTVANGKVFVATESQMLVYGLLPALSVSAGNNQSGTVGSPLPTPLSVQALNSYTGLPVAGATVTFAATPAGGTFSNPTSVTDSTGTATTTYTLPTKAASVSITASSPSTTATYFQETAVAGPPASLTVISGGNQKGTVNTTLPAPIVVSVKDSYKNGISGAAVTFTDNNSGGSFSPATANTNSSGQASTYYTLPTKTATLTLDASTGSLQAKISEQSLAGAPASLFYISGNHQSAQPNTELPLPLVVSVKDQYGNLVSGATVNFSDNGANGVFSSSSAVTASNGRATVTYTTPAQAGTVTITASTSGVANSINFTETVP